MSEEVLEDMCNAVNSSGIDIVLHLPCDRIAPLLGAMTDRFSDIPLSREEEGVGIAAGVVLAGAKPLVVVQSSGLGNMVNAVLSLTKFYELPLPIFISQRGVYKENVAAQIPMGKQLPKILEAMEVEYELYSEPGDLNNISSELESVFKENKVKCFLFSPKLWEGLTKPTIESMIGKPNQWRASSEQKLSEETEIIEEVRNPKSRLEALTDLKGFLQDNAVICNMGFPSRELYSVFDQESNFYMLGSLGLVSSIGLGVAVHSKKEVIVLDGDGSLQMNPNALLTIGALQPRNLTIICIDNGVFGSTGNQPTWSTYGLKLENLAKAVGIKRILVSNNPEKIQDITGPGPNFVRLMVKPGNAKVPTIDLSAKEIRDRFQNWLRG